MGDCAAVTVIMCYFEGHGIRNDRKKSDSSSDTEIKSVRFGGLG